MINLGRYPDILEAKKQVERALPYDINIVGVFLIGVIVGGMCVWLANTVNSLYDFILWVLE